MSDVSSKLGNAEVVVIGGTSGIGLATATMVQEAGARVTVVGRDQGRLEHVLVFDDHVDPNDYWPVFLALVTSDLR